MRFVVNFSGGACSWWAAKRIVARYGRQAVTLLFADTLIEDPELYQFLEEASADIGIPITDIRDGRTPWQVFRDERFLGNSRVDPCSRILKRELLDAWHATHCDPADTVICVGLSADSKERARYLKFRAKMRAKGWRVQAPAMEPPCLSKQEMLQEIRDRGIIVPALYEDGFPHNNCGGACVKMGQAHARLLLIKRPRVFLEWETKEQEMREFLGKDVSILSDRRGDVKKKPLTLRAFRERYEAGQLFACNDWGGCGCAIDG